MENSNEQILEVSISALTAEELIETLCETAIALYCYDLIIKNGVAPDVSEQAVIDLQSAFAGIRQELLRRASRGAKKKKVVTA